MKKLDPKHEKFCNELMIDENQSAAAIRAGYKESRARITACELMQRDDIKNRIAELRTEIAERNKITVDEIIQHDAQILRTGWAEVQEFDGFAGSALPLSELTDEQKLLLLGLK